MALLRTLLLMSSVAITALASVPAQAADYVQSRGGLSFVSSYQGETFVGVFPGFATTLSFDVAAPQSARLEVSIPLSAVTTRNGERDDTLKAAEFFNVARFATARYRATGFKPLGQGRYSTDGSLELRGISRPVTLTFTLSDAEHPVLVGGAIVKRLDFNVGGGDWADLSLIPDAVQIATRVTFVPAR
jgi:polyisoprenoid-binding protein YceI